MEHNNLPAAIPPAVDEISSPAEVGERRKVEYATKGRISPQTDALVYIMDWIASIERYVVYLPRKR